MKPAILFVTGTDTGVGKTSVSRLLLSSLRQAGYKVAAIKPIETGCEKISDGKLRAVDAELLAQASGAPCPVLYPFINAVAPSVAAELENVSIDISSIKRAVEELSAENQLLLVEGAGGLLVPIASDYTFAELLSDIGASCLIVVASRLGAINHAALTFEAMRRRELASLGYVLNHLSPREGDIVLETNPAPIRAAAKANGIRELCEIPACNFTSIGAEIESLALQAPIQQLSSAVIEYFRLTL